ncbi:PREDICTED: ras GTPase-activating protein-binding protein 2-like [Ipomoea nil]|uniref:ras GTPase-activating protein-binding protein 2-like n=1 Tax=Ipomoea nil TaxID=35883 RepID=UPI000900DD80|nr:PREDICTED: ras GTPase-activating protein-binding protein 2-like [Ipomoea nil]
MAMQTTTPATVPGPSAQLVGNAFVEQYYLILHHSPDQVYRFYQESSVLSRPDPDGSMTSVTTMDRINDKIRSLDYENYDAEIKTADAQNSYNGGVIVLVTGCLTGKDNLKRKFTQTFFLAPQDKGYFVLNDVFRYVEQDEADSNAKMVNGVDDEPTVIPSPEAPDPEPAHVPDSLNANPASSDTEEVKNVGIKIHESLEDEKQVSDEKEILVDTESHLNENQTSASLESTTSAIQDDAPKMSYASILSSQMNKGPTKIYVPTNASRMKTEKQSASMVAQVPVPEAPAPIAPSTAIDESKNAQEEAEGHSIYVRNLPFNITVAELEAVFKKYGPIKHGGIQVRSNRQQGFCFGFVEFHGLNSMNNAIQDSPIMIGDRQAVVEIKRTTTRVGMGRGRFGSGRGFRNDRLREHGDFRGGGRSSYGRGDFGDGEFSGHGRGQGGRGRGGGRRGGWSRNAAAAAASSPH